MSEPNKKLDAKIECPSCGGECNMSITKNKTIFAYCREVLDESGERCGYRGFLGRRKSREILKTVNEHKERVSNDKAENREQDREDGGNAAPSGADTIGNDTGQGEGGRNVANITDKAPANGLGSAIRHFFTANE